MNDEQIESLGAELKQILTDEAKSLFDVTVGNKADLRAYLEEISQDAARYSVAAAEGQPQAQSQMRHLKAQALLIGELTGIRASKAARETFQRVLLVLAKAASVAIAAAIA